MLFDDNLAEKVIMFYIPCKVYNHCNTLLGRRIPIVNILVVNLESKLQNDEGYMQYNNHVMQL